MQPAVPDDSQRVWASADDVIDSGVGAYRQGTQASRWALARYLVGRVIADSVSTTLYLVALAVLAVAVVIEVTVHLTFLAVLVALVALIVLFVRWVLTAILRRLTAADVYGPIAAQLKRIVDDTHRDVYRELRRLGLPSHTVTMPLLAFRLVGKRRKETLTRLRSFDIGRAVPPARVDELHMLIGAAQGRSAAQ